MKFTEFSHKKSRFNRFSNHFLIIILISLILFVPYKTVIVHEWKIRAVDRRGEPIPHAKFRQGWHNYSYDISGMEFWEADDNGYVVLPERSFYAPLIYRIPRSALAYLMTLAHGSVGNDASLNAFTDQCSSEDLTYKQIKILPEFIVFACSEK